MDSIHIIKTPLITEKSTYASGQNRYAFLVANNATKTDVKRTIESLYRVRVVGVSTHNRRSRNRRMRYGHVGGKTTKRAIVRVHPEDRIELF